MVLGEGRIIPMLIHEQTFLCRIQAIRVLFTWASKHSLYGCYNLEVRVIFYRVLNLLEVCLKYRSGVLCAGSLGRSLDSESDVPGATMLVTGSARRVFGMSTKSLKCRRKSAPKIRCVTFPTKHYQRRTRHISMFIAKTRSP